MIFARRTAPELTRWVTPEVKPAVQACFQALSQLDGGWEAIKAMSSPVLFWQGRGDVGHDRMRAFAAAHQFPFLSSAGDHVAAVLTPDAEAIEGIRAFFGRNGEAA
jgi:prophage antirepressor-like protein